MGSTTKKGRTRNRRAIAQSAPPDGFPLMIMPQIQERVDATTMSVTLYVGPATQYVPQEMQGPALIRVWNANTNVGSDVSVVWNAGLDAWDFIHPIVWTTGFNYYVLPWDTRCRGLNGEWISPSVLVPPA